MKKHRFGALVLSFILVISSCMPMGTLTAFAAEAEEIQVSAGIQGSAAESAAVEEAAPADTVTIQ